MAWVGAVRRESTGGECTVVGRGGRVNFVTEQEQVEQAQEMRWKQKYVDNWWCVTSPP